MAPDHMADKAIPLKLRTAAADAALEYADACVQYAVAANSDSVEKMVRAMDDQQTTLDRLKAACKACAAAKAVSQIG